MNYHPTVQKIKDLLTVKNIDFEEFEHKPVRTSQEASVVRKGYGLKQGVKAIIVRVKQKEKSKRFVMFVLPGDKRFDPIKVKENLGLYDIRFASEEEVEKITDGVLPGGIPPFGNLFGLEIYADREILKNERVVFNAGDRSFSIGMKISDLESAVNPNWSDIS